ncbi:MAG: holo-ACP synthase [Micrococcaceae bacterium]
MTTLGIGVDLVDIHAFSEQIALPGSSLPAIFTARERRRAEAKTIQNALHESAQHLAGIWAAKEALIKAWSNAMLGKPPIISPDKVNWQEIEVRHDNWDRPYMALSGTIAKAVTTSLGKKIFIHCSISHDGDSAIAFVTISHSSSTSS